MERHFRIEGLKPEPTTKWLMQTIRGKLVQGQEEDTMPAITTDSRLVQPKDLFIPIRGEAVDGHDFIEAACKAGASAVLCHPGTPLPKTKPASWIEVSDTLMALGDIAHAWRKQFSLPVIALTGANGKTTTKEMLLSILKEIGKPLATWKNWNNLVGLPLTLLRLRAHHTHALLEMGMNHFGEIKRLTQIAEPQVRLITNVLPVHLEGVGDLNGVLRAKSEILTGIQSDHTFILNQDDPMIRRMEIPAPCKKIRYSLLASKEVDVFLDEVQQHHRRGFSGCLHIADHAYDFELPLPGEHNLSNMLAAVAAAYALNIEPKSILNGMAKVQAMDLRGQWVALNQGIGIFNDCYNANPASMRAALKTGMTLAGSRKIAVLGDMQEMGESVERAHLDTLMAAKELGFDAILCLGPFLQKAAETLKEATIRTFDEMDPLLRELKTLLQPNDLIVVKGSRLMAMERVAECLKESLGEAETPAKQGEK